MAAITMALALLGGVIGAGFASGREILRFFAGHGRMAGVAIACALMTLFALFIRLPALMQHHGADTLIQLCRIRLGERFGLFCGWLFMLLCAVTGAAMLAAMAELGALMLPIRHAYALTMVFSLSLSLLLALCGLTGLAVPGALLAVLLVVLLMRLYHLPAGEACFLPAMTPDLPVRASLDGAVYGALSSAQMAGMLARLGKQTPRIRLRSAVLFALLFGGILSLGTAVCQRHMPALIHQPLPFVYLGRALGFSGYMLVALCMYAAALSTLCAMLHALMPPGGGRRHALIAALACLLPALLGFDVIIAHGYPLLGTLCAGLLLALCLPVCQKASMSEM